MILDDLEHHVVGPVIRPGDPAYDDERLGYQRAGAHRPAVIVGAAVPDDIVAAVRAAAAAGERVAVQSSGHGLASPLDGGVLISTRRMNTVEVDPEVRAVRFQAGVTGRALLEATVPHGLVPLLGSSPSVGAVSYTLGGGIGLLARRYGYAADHVLALDVVTPDGRRRRVSPTEEPELFWGLRGGGGNLAVVVAIETALQPVERFYGGGLYIDLDASPDALERWWRWTTGISEDVTSAVSITTYPALDVFPAALHGRHVLHLQVVHLGAREDAERALTGLRSLPLLLDTVAEQPVAALGGAFAEPDFPHAFRSRSRLVTVLDGARLAALVDRAAPSSELPTIVAVRHLGGALGREPAVPNAVGLRHASYSVGCMSLIEPGQEGLADEVAAAALTPFDDVAVGRSLNFTYGPIAPAEVRDAYLPGDAERLASLRAKTDPTGLLVPNYELEALAVESRR